MRFVLLLYKSLTLIYTQESYSDSSAKLRKILYLFINTQLLLQNVNFFWKPDMPIKNWSNFEQFWKSLNFACIDSLAAAYNLSKEFMMIIVCSIALATLILSLILLLVYFEKGISNLLIKSFYGISCFLCDLYFIPASISLITLIKYSSQRLEYLEEYVNKVPGSTLNYGELGQIGGFFAILVLIMLTIIFETCAYDMRYSLKNNFHTRVHPGLGIFLKLFYFIQCILFTTLQIRKYETYLSILCLLYLLVTMIIIYQMPFHSFFSNSVLIFIHLDALYLNFIFLLQIWVDSATVGIVLSFIMQPFILLLSMEMSRFLLNRKCKKRNAKFAKIIELEHYLREKLLKHSVNPKILELFNKNVQYNMKFNNDKLIRVIQAYYCLEALGDPELAYIKIGTCEFSGFNFLINYQVFKCKDMLESLNCELSEGLKLFLFHKDFDVTKKIDFEICLSLLSLFRKILYYPKDIKLIKSLLIKDYQMIRTTKRKYKKLIKEVPDSIVLLDIYSSFLFNILHDENEGIEFLQRRNRLLTELGGSKPKESMTRKDCPILITSGSKSISGKIVYANDKMLEILGHNSESIKECYLSQFIPKPFDHQHSNLLYNFPSQCMSRKIICNSFNFISVNEFLVECQFETECIIYGEKPYFLSTFEVSNIKTRSVILLDSTGFIMSASENFLDMFSITSYKEKNIEDILHEPNFLKKPIQIPINIQKNTLVGIIDQIKLKSGTFFVVYFSPNNQELKSIMYKKSYSIKDPSMHMLPNQQTLLTRKPPAIFQNKTTYFEESKIEDKFKVSFTQSNSYVAHYANVHKETLALNKSTKSFKIMMYILCITVFFI